MAAIALTVAAPVAGCAGGAPAQAAAVDAAPADLAAAAGAKAACVDPTPPVSPCLKRWCDNPHGVGMPCVKDGGQCAANKDKGGDTGVGAVICTAQFGASLAFCTKPCGDDSDCGAGAACREDPDKPGSGFGCVPLECAGPAPAKPDAVADAPASAGDVGASADATSATDAAPGG